MRGRRFLRGGTAGGGVVRGEVPGGWLAGCLGVLRGSVRPGEVPVRLAVTVEDEDGALACYVAGADGVVRRVGAGGAAG